MTRAKQLLDALYDAGDKGLTVKSSMELNIGTEMRRCITTLIRQGHNITEKWERKNGRKYKRYFIAQQEVKRVPVFEIREVEVTNKLPDDLGKLRDLYREAKKRGDKFEMIRITTRARGLKDNNLLNNVKKALL